MPEQNSSLFSPFTVGDLHLKNRVVMAPMTRLFAHDNAPTAQVVDYYRKRAAGGVGLIITEGATIDHITACGNRSVPFFHGSTRLERWKQVCDAVHAEGAKIMPQLWHVGAVRHPENCPNPEIPSCSPSGLFRNGHVKAREMTEADIADVIDAFARAAVDAKRIGMDGVELHGGHGYLIDQFFCAALNKRTDRWGGNLTERTRFACEIIKAIRERTGPNFPIVLRWSQIKRQALDAKLVHTPQELESFLSPLADAGVDMFHCATLRLQDAAFEDSDLSLAGWTRKLSGKPCIAVGCVGLDRPFLVEGIMVGYAAPDFTTVNELSRRIDDGEFDLVAVGRALIANPSWANEIKAGKYTDIREYRSEMLQQLDG